MTRMKPYEAVDGRICIHTVPSARLENTYMVQYGCACIPYGTVQIRPYTVYGTVLTPKIPAGRPGTSNLLTILSACTSEVPAALELLQSQLPSPPKTYKGDLPW